MGHWNLRILAFKDKEQVIFLPKEVHYTDDDKPRAHGSVSLICENQKGLEVTMDRLKEAFDKPVLWGDEEKWPEEYDGNIKFK